MKFKKFLPLLIVAATALTTLTSCFSDNDDDNGMGMQNTSSLYLDKNNNIIVSAPVSGSGNVQAMPGCDILIKVDANARTLAASFNDLQYDSEGRAESFDYPATSITYTTDGFQAVGSAPVMCQGAHANLEISNFRTRFKNRSNGTPNLVEMSMVINNRYAVSIEFTSNLYSGTTSSAMLSQPSTFDFSSDTPQYLITLDRSTMRCKIVIEQPIFSATSASTQPMTISEIPLIFTADGYEFSAQETIPVVNGQTDRNKRLTNLRGNARYGNSITISFDSDALGRRVTFSGKVI